MPISKHNVLFQRLAHLCITAQRYDDDDDDDDATDKDLVERRNYFF